MPGRLKPVDNTFFWSEGTPMHAANATLNRRRFLIQSGMVAAAATTLRVSAAEDKEKGQEKDPPLRISLAQWTINQDLRSGKIDNLDFAKVAHDHGIFAIEYVNQFFMDKAKDEKYLGEMKKRAADLGVKSLLIMCDNEGQIGDPDSAKRGKTVENHRKWLDAAKFLGCHSIRVNAGSSGTWEEQVKLAADGLARLTEFGAQQDLNVIVENHGGLSSNADWLAEVITKVDHPRCGTLPDSGNFQIKKGESYDTYRGMAKLMKWAKGVSVKDQAWDDKGNSSPLDFERMLKIVLEAGFHGYCGIEYGGYAGLNESRETLQRAIDKVTA
jgi:sugar phosphate isomerase/epimerase